MPATQSDGRVPRRDFLELAWKGLLATSSALGLGALARFFDYSNDPPVKTQFDLGAEDQYPPGSRTPIPEAQAVLIREGETFRALSTVCPHLGCTVDPTPDGFACRCHSSRFDRAGGLVRGPATRPLSALRVERTANGRVILHTD